jgi:uncharacterized repeat protein (TIGR02543 family)
VTLTATPDPGSTFSGWSGDCSGSGACVVALTTARQVRATFRRSGIAGGSSVLTVTNPLAPSGGVATEGVGILRVSVGSFSASCTGQSCSYTIANGATVTAVAVGGHFNNWTGVCSGEAATCVFVMDGSASLRAGFFVGIPETVAWGLNVTHSLDGSVVSVPPGIDCGSGSGCSAGYKPTISVQLTATPAPGFAFVGWQGDCSGTSVCTVTMDASHSVTAAFRRNRAQVTVQLLGAGTGVVSSNPAGVECGVGCTYPFTTGTVVTLTAGANAGSRFAGWLGACSGTGACSVTANADVQASARFVRCAAAAPGALTAHARAHPRRVAVSLGLSDGATVLARLTRAGTPLATRGFSFPTGGARTFTLPVGARIRSGRATVSVTVRDLCGGARTLTRSVQVPR